MLHSIGISFRRVSTRVLADWLKLDASALKQLLADKVGQGGGVRGWVGGRRGADTGARGCMTAMPHFPSIVCMYQSGYGPRTGAAASGGG